LRSPPAPTSPLRAWLSGVLRNLIYKRRRGDARRDRREQVAAAEPAEGIKTPDLLFDDCEAQEQVALLLSAVTEPYRQTLRLRFFEQLGNEEIGQLLGVPPATVRSRVRRGLYQLRRLVREQRDHGTP